MSRDAPDLLRSEPAAVGFELNCIMPLSHYGCMQVACSLHVDRLSVVDAVQPSANALQAIDIRGFADRHASY
jgi:hypothetical protein